MLELEKMIKQLNDKIVRQHHKKALNRARIFASSQIKSTYVPSDVAIDFFPSDKQMKKRTQTILCMQQDIGMKYRIQIEKNLKEGQNYV